MTITKAYIEAQYQRLLSRATFHVAVHMWAIKPTAFDITNHKTALGVCRSDGRVGISNVFLGTGDYEQLTATILHEIAHLIAGIGAGHGVGWKRVMRMLGQDVEASYKNDGGELSKKLQGRYTLVAVLTCGREVEIKRAHKKHKKYTEYDAMRRPLRIKEGSISRFEYRL